jgi:putative Mg2+ transporter-C (MgtC) family protein
VDPLTDIEAIKRLAVAMAVGIALGFEREQSDKPAGMRTFMLVVEGAALFMICGILLSNQMAMEGRISDPGRIASTVIQGIGFIAAGVIITTGREVKGLTTAAGIWVAAALGLLIGAGFYLIAVTATAATILAVVVFGAVERRILGTKSNPDDRLSD